MPMVTRCPSCNTLFRVTPQQLQAHNGEVRCGRCTMVFDGFKRLATLPGEAPRDPPSLGTAENALSPAAQDNGVVQREVKVERESAAPAAPEPPAAVSVPAGFEFEAVGPHGPLVARPAVTSPAKPILFKPAANSGTAVASSPTVSADALFLEQAHAKRGRGSRLWTAGSLLMLLALAAQAAYLYRGEVAASYPSLKLAVTRLCGALGCSVPLPQRPKLINIEASDLQSVDPARPGVIQLTATLRNLSGYDLGYPALDLALTNTKEHTLARRIFLPEEYLQKDRDAKAGFAADAEITIRLDLDTGELGAAGFRLDLLPAPTP